MIFVMLIPMFMMRLGARMDHNLMEGEQVRVRLRQQVVLNVQPLEYENENREPAEPGLLGPNLGDR